MNKKTNQEELLHGVGKDCFVAQNNMSLLWLYHGQGHLSENCITTNYI